MIGVEESSLSGPFECKPDGFELKVVIKCILSYEAEGNEWLTVVKHTDSYKLFLLSPCGLNDDGPVR